MVWEWDCIVDWADKTICRILWPGHVSHHYNFDLKCLFNEWLIVIDHAVQNITDTINISGFMRDQRPVNPMNNVDSNRRDSLVYHIDDNSTNDRNRERADNFEDLELEKADSHEQNQRTLCIVPNTRYYNFLYHLK